MSSPADSKSAMSSQTSLFVGILNNNSLFELMNDLHSFSFLDNAKMSRIKHMVKMQILNTPSLIPI